jgi:predicted acylesterase/phospholipase RssA/CRP-like cAMP-binding protein
MQEVEDRGGHREALRAACKNIFGPLDDSLMNELLDELSIVEIGGGSALFSQGDPGDSLYILLRGRLNVSLRDPETGFEKVVGETAAGESVGEIGLLTGEPRSASLWATRDCRLARIGQEAFDALARKNPELLRGLAKVVVELLQKRTSSQRYSPRISCIAILPIHAKNGTSDLARGLRSTLERAGSTLHVDSERVDEMLGIAGASMASPQSSDGARLGDWLSAKEEEHRFLLLEADAEATEWTRRCLRQADMVLVVGNSADDPVVTATEHDLLHQGEALGSVRHVFVLLHPETTEKIEGTARWLEMRDVEEHHHVRIGRVEDVERLGRIIAGTAVGLVLGGGGARGFAHAGVYRALCERGIPIDWVGGSSIGAVFGAGIGMGWDPARVEEEARLSFVEGKPFGDYTVPLVALLRGKRIDRLAQRSFAVDIEDMPIPYFCVSSDLTAACLEVHERGPLWKAIRASVSLPGVLPPAVKSNHLAIDGGILNNLPVDIMRDRSVGTVIAVDLSASKEYELEYPEIPGPLRILLSRLPFGRRLQVPGIVTLMMKATVMASAVHSRAVRSEATLLLNPPVGRFGLLAMNDFEEIVEVGYRYACERLADWPVARADGSSS